MPAPTQSNTQVGDLSFNSAVDLSAKEGYIVKLARKDANTPEVDLPAAVTDIAPFVVVDGGVLDEESTVRPLTTGRNVRIYATGSGQAGDKVTLSASTYGKVKRATGSTGGRVIGIFEQDFADGQLALVRPIELGLDS